MTFPGDQRYGDQVYTGQDSFDFGTGRAEMERMMRMRQPFVVTSDSPDEPPFIATEQGQKLIAGMVFGMYWGTPIAAQMARKLRKARAARIQDRSKADGANGDTSDQ